MQVQHYNDAVADRAAGMLCGYPLCGDRLQKELPENPIVFDMKQMVMRDISEISVSSVAFLLERPRSGACCGWQWLESTKDQKMDGENGTAKLESQAVSRRPQRFALHLTLHSPQPAILQQ